MLTFVVKFGYRSFMGVKKRQKHAMGRQRILPNFNSSAEPSLSQALGSRPDQEMLKGHLAQIAI